MTLTNIQFKFVKYCKKNPKLVTRKLRDIIHGYILADGHVKKDANMGVQHCEEQIKFVQWLYEKLKPVRTDYGITYVTQVHPKTGVKRHAARFNTRNLLYGFRSMWYEPDPDKKTPEGEIVYRKKLPKTINAILSPTVLSVWFAGDGTRIEGSRGAKIEATCFTPKERLILQSVMARKFGVEVHINKAGVSKTGTQQWTLNINSPDYARFRELITQIDLIPKIFPYKLHTK